MNDLKNPSPPDGEQPEDFKPESGEIEPAGGIVKKPPVPENGEAPTEGDRR